MKKVIILCSALVFDFLTCPEASAYNAREEAVDIESKLTELIGLVNSQNEKNSIVQHYTQRIKKLVNAPKQMWMGAGNLKIEGDGTVQFTGEKVNKPSPRGKIAAQAIVKEIEKEIQSRIEKKKEIEREARSRIEKKKEIEKKEEIEREEENNKTLFDGYKEYVKNLKNQQNEK